MALLDRIIKASSNPGDMVLDPFCGCVTALVAAERLGRQWAAIDLSLLASKLVKERILQDNLPWGGTTERMEAPIRTDVKKLPHYREEAHRLYGVQEGICAGCHTHSPFRVMDVDHILGTTENRPTFLIECPLTMRKSVVEGCCMGWQAFQAEKRRFFVVLSCLKSRGGTDHPDNLQLLCSGCNRSKRDKTMAEWKAT